MEKISLQELKDRYEKGERDFSDTDIRMNQFDNMNLSGCNFSGSNLSFSSFRSANLNGCNFTGANVEWSNFSRANLDNTDFSGAKAWYSCYNDATIKDAVFTNADMSYSLFLNVEKNYKDITGTQFHLSAWHESELSKTAVQDVQLQLMSARGLIPEDLYTRLTFTMHSNMENAQKVNIEQGGGVGKYNIGFDAGMSGYKVQGGAVGNAYSTGTGENVSYSGKGRAYSK